MGSVTVSESVYFTVSAAELFSRFKQGEKSMLRMVRIRKKPESHG